MIEIKVTNVKICPCDEGLALVYDLDIPETPDNLNKLKLVGLTTIKEEVDPSKSCAIVPDEPVVTYVAPVLPNNKSKKRLAALPKATPQQLERVKKNEGQLIKVKRTKNARLGLRDHKIIDGDIVTILVNGHILVEAYELKKKMKWFDLPLIKGENQITLFAENLGRKVPNTAAITLKSGKVKEEVILFSDLEESAFFVVRVE